MLGHTNLDWVELAFHTAHQTDPEATLIMSDFGIELGGEKTERIAKIVKRLIEDSVPIQVVAFQCHFDGKDFLGTELERKKELFQDSIKRFKELGVEVCVGEIDIAMDNVTGNEREKQEIQAQIYKTIIESGLHSGVRSISFFGENDRHSFYTNTGRPDANATIFDENSEPKPAYFAIRQFLSDKLLQELSFTPTPNTP
jgi:endo-1,4-beta-xylanase